MRRTRELFCLLPLISACDDGTTTVRVCAGGGAAHSTIAAAVAAAPDGARLEICAGTHVETLDLSGRALHLRGEGAGLTVVDAGGAGRAVTVTGGADVVLEGLTLRGGVADLGGGVLATDSALEVRGCAVEGNHAGKGGGLYLAVDARIEDTVIAGNTSDWTGGGVFADGHAPWFVRATIDGNQAAWEGGGLYLHRSQATIEDSAITGNTAVDDGGGVRIFESEATLARNVIAGNVAGGDGGGVKCSHVPSRFVDNEITGNRAEGDGGGLELDNDASHVQGGVIAGNQAGRGGGVHVMLAPWEGGSIEDVRIADNTAWLGGGLALEDNYQPITVRRVTLTGNLADRGGGLYQRGGHVVLANAVIAANQAYGQGGGLYLTASEPWDEPCPCPPANPPVEIDFVVLHGNQAGWGEAIWTDAPSVSIESSIVAAHDGAAVVSAPGARPTWRYNDTFPAAFAGMDDPTGGEGNLAVDPRLVAPAADDYRLGAGSACIDAGDPDAVDRDGSRADMGAHAGPGAP